MNTAKIELHLHLDGSIDLPWAYSVAQRQGDFGCDLSYDEYYNTMYFTGWKTREEGFKKFDLTCAVLQTKENLFEAAYRLVKKLAEMGMIYAEIRFASQQHCLKGLTQTEALAAVCDGVKAAMADFPTMTAKVLNCLMHKGNSAAFNSKENFETIEAVRSLFDEGICVGLDLAGFENNCPIVEYAPLFEKAREYGIPYTIHAGEMGNGANVVDALNMGAHRIGHGVNCVNDPTWLEAAKNSGKVFEVCLSSNCKQREYITHPVRDMIKSGIKVAFCCDNMMFSRTDMRYEHELLKGLGLTEKDLIQASYNAIDGAFCDETTKDMLRAKMKELGLVNGQH